VAEPRQTSTSFQFFPSCSPTNPTARSAAPISLFQFFPSCSAASPPSLPPAYCQAAFQFFPSCSLLRQPGPPDEEVHFQFFPSCSAASPPSLPPAYCQAAFQFFPSCSLLRQPGPPDEEVHFQFFPSCSVYQRLKDAPYKFRVFQFFPSCSRGPGSMPPYKPFLRELRSSWKLTRTASRHVCGFAEALSRFPAERGNLEGKERCLTANMGERTSGPRAERLEEGEGSGTRGGREGCRALEPGGSRFGPGLEPGLPLRSCWG